MEGPQLAKLLDFDNLDAGSFVALLGQVRQWLDSLGRSELLMGLDIPFVQGAVGEVLDLADAFGDALLIDDLDVEPNGFAAVRALGFDRLARSDETGRLLASDPPPVVGMDEPVTIAFALAVDGAAPVEVRVSTDNFVNPDADPADDLTLDELVMALNESGVLPSGVTASAAGD